MHKKVEQAHGLSLRNLFEQLATRILPAAVPSEGKIATFLPLKQQNRINFCIFEH